jgi:hypothetical protein
MSDDQPDEPATVQHHLTVHIEGKCQVRGSVQFHSLDTILATGELKKAELTPAKKGKPNAA